MERMSTNSWLEGQIQLDIICISMDTRQVDLKDFEDPR